MKTGAFLPYYGGLDGTIVRLFKDDTAAVSIDPASMTADMRERHEAQTKQMHEKWLNSLSDEARNRLSPEEKKFSLNYVLLFSTSDLEPAKGKAAAKTTDKPTKDPKRKTSKEIESEEQAYLEQFKKKPK